MIDGKLYHESTRQGNSKVARHVETKARQAVLTGEPLPGSAPTLAKFITENRAVCEAFWLTGAAAAKG